MHQVLISPFDFSASSTKWLYSRSARPCLSCMFLLGRILHSQEPANPRLSLIEFNRTIHDTVICHGNVRPCPSPWPLAIKS